MVMEDLDILLSDQFIEFSKKIAAIAEKKKVEKQEFEKVFEAFKKTMKSLDDEAKKLQKDFEKWKDDKNKSPVN